MMRRMLINVAVLMIAMWGAAAHADIISGDFRTEAGFEYPNTNITGTEKRIYERLGATIGAGYELDSSHLIATPSWGGGAIFVDLDPLTNILTLVSQDFWGVDLFTASISNMSFSDGAVITGISLISSELTFDIPPVTPTWSFTSNSVFVSYDVLDTNGFYFSGGSATFQLTTSVTPVPEPEIYAMMGLGLGLMGWVGRRRKQQAA